MGALLIPLAVTHGTAAGAQDNPCGQVSCAEVIAYLRTLPPQTLIEITFAHTSDTATMLRIARRESGFDCAADNPRSSAAGLFQTIGMHRQLAEAHGLSWANIAGPDCLDDVWLAKVLYDGSGLRPWQ